MAMVQQGRVSCRPVNPPTPAIRGAPPRCRAEQRDRPTPRPPRKLRLLAREQPMTLDLIQRLEHLRAEEKRLAWRGTFADYFELVRNNPSIARLAHARVYDMIVESGIESDDHGDSRYNFFANDIYGIDAALDQLVEYFHSAAQRLEVRKRILLLMGPVGGGKSTLVSLLKRGLEQYTRSDAGAVYAIAGCPMHEEPLHLVPDALRPEIEREFGIYVEG